MSENELVITDYYELVALYKALIEAKFHPDPENLLVSGSPFVASISKRVVELLIKMDVSKDPANKISWDRMLDIKNQTTHWDRAIDYAQKFNLWDRFGELKKKEYVECLLSPYRYSDDDVQKFIKLVNDKRKKDGIL